MLGDLQLGMGTLGSLETISDDNNNKTLTPYSIKAKEVMLI